MYKKLTLAVAALAVSAACIGASSASAVTLYASSAHTSIVTVGTTFTAKMPPASPEASWHQAWPNGEPLEDCVEVSIDFKVTQNSAGVFKAAPTAMKFPACNWSEQSGHIMSGLPPMEVSGSSIAVGSNSDWLGTKLSLEWYSTYWGLSLANFTGATGNPPVKGVYVQQPTAAKAPITIVLDKAALKPGSSTVSAKIPFIGAAAAWSFG
jgi:hypothetical protein